MIKNIKWNNILFDGGGGKEEITKWDSGNFSFIMTIINCPLNKITQFLCNSYSYSFVIGNLDYWCNTYMHAIVI